MKSYELLKILKLIESYGFSANVGSGVADFQKNTTIISLTLARNIELEELASIVWTDRNTPSKEFNIQLCHNVKSAEIKDNCLLLETSSKTLKIDLS